MFRTPLLLLSLALSCTAAADTLRIPVGSQGAPAIAMPQNGQARAEVLERFGLADEEHAPVGNPPITRWDYREFSVYFERDRVISSVRHHRPAGGGNETR
ncbi:hypothetical protein [Stutzerimonas azotifigens]|uniref:hypothetical protein n=1 Tax=Stutzerimonas azotifigens TaxID=291995 RepID=UPI00040279EA|nr:hypothetical protein [Stutzerimonas azotifigens]